MNVYFLRHGDAEYGSKADHLRELTSDGKEKLKIAAAGWAELIPSLDKIFSSPLKRAVQTAEIVKDVFSLSGKIEIDERITSGCRFDEVLSLINSAGKENFMIVGHMPDLSYHVSAFLGTSGSAVNFGKGTIAKVNFMGKAIAGRGTLEWLLPQECFK